jgi:hypothetical protein
VLAHGLCSLITAASFKVRNLCVLAFVDPIESLFVFGQLLLLCCELLFRSIELLLKVYRSSALLDSQHRI